MNDMVKYSTLTDGNEVYMYLGLKGSGKHRVRRLHWRGEAGVHWGHPFDIDVAQFKSLAPISMDQFPAKKDGS